MFDNFHLSISKNKHYAVRCDITSTLTFIPQDTVDNNPGPDWFSRHKVKNIAGSQPFDFKTLVWQSELCMVMNCTFFWLMHPLPRHLYYWCCSFDITAVWHYDPCAMNDDNTLAEVMAPHTKLVKFNGKENVRKF